MGNLCEDLWVEILGRLSSEKDLVPFMSVSKLWHRITSDLWVRRFWVQSPPLGIYCRTIRSPLSPFMLTLVDKEPSYLPRMNYISLYNYHIMEDNQESTSAFHVCKLFNGSREHFSCYKRMWQSYRHYEPDDDDHDEYLHGCNGLLLLLKLGTYHFYVCNPITAQQVPVPKDCVHQNHKQHFCAALAFDPSESPHHYRVVRIDYSESTSNSARLDIFSSEYGQWVRHRLQLDPGFTEGFKKLKLCRQFFYLRGKLFIIAMSWKILCIDLQTVEACALDLPVKEADKTGAMGCLGVSMDLLCYLKRMPGISSEFYDLVVWYYDDRSEWTLKYRVSCCLLGYSIYYQGYDYDDTVEPYAISPSSDVLFFGTPNLISCYHLKSKKSKLVFLPPSSKIAPDYFWILRACFVPFYRLGNRNTGSTPALSKENHNVSSKEFMSSSSDVLFFGTPNLISCYHLKSKKSKLVFLPPSSKIAPDYFWILRACFVPFYRLGNRNTGSTPALAMVSEGIRILTAEVTCEEKKDDDKVEVINVKLCHHWKKPLPPLIYPSEINKIHLEFNLPRPSICNEE